MVAVPPILVFNWGRAPMLMGMEQILLGLLAGSTAESRKVSSIIGSRAESILARCSPHLWFCLYQTFSSENCTINVEPQLRQVMIV